MNFYNLKNLIFFIIMNSGNFFNYLFIIILTKIISVDVFGTYSSINSLISILTVPTAILIFLSSRKYLHGHLNFLSFRSKNLLITFLFFSLIIFIIFFVYIYFYLNLPSSYFIVVFSSSTVVFSYLICRPLGLLQAKGDYILFSISSVFFSPSKIVFILFFVYLLNLKLNGIFLSISLSVLVTFLVAFYFNFITKKDINFKKEIKEDNSHNVYFVISSIVVMALAQSDIYIIKLHNNFFETGIYSAASLLGKIIYFLPSVFLVILYPETTKNKENLNYLKNLIIFTIIMSFIYLLSMYFLSDIIFSITFKSEYLIARKYIFLSIIMFSLLSILSQIIIYLNAKSDYKYFRYLLIISILLFFLFHFIEIEIITFQLAMICYCLLLFLIIYLVVNKNNKQNNLSKNI